MKKFKLPDDLCYNTGLIKDPASYFKESKCASWLCLTGEEFANMENGMSFQQVQAITANSINVVSDPPRNLDLNLAHQHVKALDSLPKPTLISCRMGPRSSAAAYMYAGLKQGADPEDVIATAEQDNAPFTRFEEYKDWVRHSILSLRSEDTRG